MFNRKTFTPVRIRVFILSDEFEAGPSVATIFVLRFLSRLICVTIDIRFSESNIRA